MILRKIQERNTTAPSTPRPMSARVLEGALERPPLLSMFSDYKKTMRKLIIIKGKVSRFFRKTFKKSADKIKNGLSIFQEYADIYEDSINSIDKAEKFFGDFMEEMGCYVNVDFLDTDNWDCIRKVEIDKEKGLIWLFWQILEDNEEYAMMRKMFLPHDFYGVCLKFDNIRFIRGKNSKCYAICVNGYTLTEKSVKKIASAEGWQINRLDKDSSFFSTDVTRTKDRISQFWRFMNTPISSFWIIPKLIDVHPQNSKKYLYIIGIEKCEKLLNDATKNLERFANLKNEEQKVVIKSSGNEMRNVAESLFKLVTCFYQEQYHFKSENTTDALNIQNKVSSLTS